MSTKRNVLHAAALLFLLGSSAQAAQTTWTISNGMFNDGGQFSGWFTVDSSTSQLINWDIYTFGGDTTHAPPSEYSPQLGASTIFSRGTIDTIRVVFGQVGPGTPHLLLDKAFIYQAASPAVLSGSETRFYISPTAPMNLGTYTRGISSGALAFASPVPELSTSALTLLGLVTMSIFAFRIRNHVIPPHTL